MERNGMARQEMKEMQDGLPREHEELKNLFRKVDIINREQQKIMDSVGDMIILTDHEGKIKRVNRAVTEYTNSTYQEIIGIDWEELIDRLRTETKTFYAGSVELYQPESQKWLLLNSYPFEDTELNFSGIVITLHDSTEMKKITAELENVNRELEAAYSELKATQSQMVHGEKMASIGQLAAGVAHEINNPMGFITSNLRTLSKYVNKLTEFIQAQDQALGESQGNGISGLRKQLKIDYIAEDIGQLISESLEGADRVRKIVQNLKSFSRVDNSEFQEADINECIESTLNIVWNELKYKATVEKEYGDIPRTKCYPQELNQVFVNLLVNAAHAIEKQGTIRIRTWNGNSSVNVSISDTGCGIPKEIVNRIFEPFFTTKEVGKGTGLGLSISYDIVKKHNGAISVESDTGRGTTFTVQIPVVGDK